MKKHLALGLVLLVGLTAVPGCPSPPPAKQPEVEGKAAPKNDMRRVGLELIRQAPDVARTWEGLELLNADIQKSAQARDGLKPQTRPFLQKDGGLTDEELQEVDSPTYRRADAHYLAECFLMRDAARSLEVSGMPPEEVASLALAWVDRHVLLHEQGDDWLPPAQVLLRGYGSPRDRARVFLAVLRQLPMEGCTIVLPEAPEDVVLVGAFAPAARDSVYLFDPRHGCPLRTLAGKMATLKDLQQNPKLIAAAGLDAKQLAAAQARLAVPLSALPARMRDLQRALQVTDRIVLYLDAPAVQQDCARLTGLPVGVWNTPATGGQVTNSPTRALRLFLPPEDGGIDKTQRRDRYQADLLPRVEVLRALHQLQLNELPDLAREPLLRQIDDMLRKFDLQPHEMLLHGKGEDAIRRISRAQVFFDDESLDNLTSDPAALQQAVVPWREKLLAAYAALANGAPGGQADVNKFWAEDQFLLTLLHTEGEDRLNNPLPGHERAKPPHKTLTTSIVAYAVRDHLRHRALWLRAIVWHDKALREQARADREPDAAKRQQRLKSVHGAWANTRVAWNQIKDRAAVSPSGRQQRLEAIRALLKRDDARSAIDAAQLLAALQLELHQHYAANLHYARAVYHLDGPRPALAILRSIDADIAALTAKDKAGQAGLQSDVDEAISRLRAASIHPGLLHSTALLASDWAANGNYYWIRQRIARQIAAWEKS